MVTKCFATNKENNRQWIKEKSLNPHAVPQSIQSIEATAVPSPRRPQYHRLNAWPHARVAKGSLSQAPGCDVIFCTAGWPQPGSVTFNTARDDYLVGGCCCQVIWEALAPEVPLGACMTQDGPRWEGLGACSMWVCMLCVCVCLFLFLSIYMSIYFCLSISRSISPSIYQWLAS